MNHRKSVFVSTAFLATFATTVSAFDNLNFDVAGGDELEEDLRQASALVAASDEDVTDTAELIAAARSDYGRLIGALYSEGHYGGVINIEIDGREVAEISPLTPIDRIGEISVTVRPGPLYRFSRTNIAPLAPETELPDGFRIGEPARSGLVRDAAEDSVDAWRQVGRATAEIADQTVTAQHDADRLAVDVAISPGPIVTFGNLLLDGTAPVRPDRIRAIAGLPTGEIYDPDDVETSEARLRRTGVFSSVSLSGAETLRPGDILDIEAELVAFPPRRIGAGAEISTVDGLTLSGFWLHRNLLGGAERFRVDGEVSGLGGGTGGMDYTFGARFERPATFSPENTFFTEAIIARLEEPDYTSTTGSVAAGISRIVNEQLTVEYGLGYRFSRVEDEFGTTDYSLALIPLAATYDTRVEPLNATRGLYADLTLSPFVGLNDETGTGARATFDARTYLSFGADDRVTLAGRVIGGSILGADLLEVPNEYRFYSGGGGSVRGQEYQSLGVLIDGNETGGASFVGLSGEVRTGVTESIELVAFYDYGIVGEDSFPGSASDSHSGAGLGIRYQTPIGPIRLDVAAPVRDSDYPDDDDGGGVEIYIGIGQAF